MIDILELTVPINTPINLQQARHRKQNRGWTVTYGTLEIGSLGHFQKETINAVKSILPSVLSDSRAATKQLGSESPSFSWYSYGTAMYVLGSMIIFSA